MSVGEFVAYYRVSSAQQGKSGLGLEAQRTAVRDYLNGGSWVLLAEFTEVESGKRTDRPQLDQAIKLAKRSRATLVIAKLDRLARNVNFVSGLMEAGVEFVAVDMPLANKLTIHILAAVAEHEREMISVRTKAALAAAKARGTILGNQKNLGMAQLNSRNSRTRRSRAFGSNVLPIIGEIRRAGVLSLSGIASALNARGVRTPRGNDWQATQVKRLIGKASEASQ